MCEVTWLFHQWFLKHRNITLHVSLTVFNNSLIICDPLFYWFILYINIINFGYTLIVSFQTIQTNAPLQSAEWIQVLH